MQIRRLQISQTFSDGSRLQKKQISDIVWIPSFSLGVDPNTFLIRRFLQESQWPCTVIFHIPDF